MKMPDDTERVLRAFSAAAAVAYSDNPHLADTKVHVARAMRAMRRNYPALRGKFDGVEIAHLLRTAVARLNDGKG